MSQNQCAYDSIRLAEKDRQTTGAFLDAVNANHTSPLMRTIHNLMKGKIMEDQNKEVTEVVETEEKKPNKIVQFVKDHKDRIRDITIGAAAAAGLALLIHLGKSEDVDDEDDNWDYSSSDESNSNAESTDSL